MLWWLGPATNALALLVAFLGALFLAVSFSAPSKTHGQLSPSGEVWGDAVLRHPKVFRAGLVLITVGFAMQFAVALCLLSAQGGQR